MCIAPISDFAYSVKYFSVTASIDKVIKQSISAGLWGERERLEWQQRFRGETWDIKRLQRSRLEFTVPRWSWSGGRLPVPHQEGGAGGRGWEEKWWVVHVLLWTPAKGFFEYLCRGDKCKVNWVQLGWHMNPTWVPPGRRRVPLDYHWVTTWAPLGTHSLPLWWHLGITGIPLRYHFGTSWVLLWYQKDTTWIPLEHHLGTLF